MFSSSALRSLYLHVFNASSALEGNAAYKSRSLPSSLALYGSPGSANLPSSSAFTSTKVLQPGRELCVVLLEAGLLSLSWTARN